MTAVKKNIAVIGAGYWGKNLVRNFAAIGALAAVADADPQRLAAVAQAHPDVTLHDDPERAMADPAIEGVAIATPAETHAALVAAALHHDKHVFVEKPLCLEMVEGRELVRAAEAKGLTLMVGHLLHYHPAVIRLKEMVDGGQVGQLQYIYSNRLNLGKIRQEENIIWSFAPHDVSLILALTGETPEQVTSFGGNYLQPEIADVTVSTLSFPSGVKAHIFVNWLHPFKEQKLVVVGTEGMVVFDDTAPKDKLLFYPHRIRWQHRLPVPEKMDAQIIALAPAEPLKNECLHFVECIRTGLQPRTDGKEGLAVLGVLDACHRSLVNGGAPVRPGHGEHGQQQDQGYTVHPTAVIDHGCVIGKGSRVWHFAHVISGSRIGDNCSLGQNVVVGPNVTIGRGCKIQNNVSVYDGVTLEDGVFCGPSMVFTNVYNPRAEISRKDQYRKTLVRRGATLGANCTIVCGNTVGRHAFVAAGAVVTRDVADFALAAGNPARRIGWMCRCGVRLNFDDGQTARCVACGEEYLLERGMVRPSQEPAGL